MFILFLVLQWCSSNLQGNWIIPAWDCGWKKSCTVGMSNIQFCINLFFLSILTGQPDFWSINIAHDINNITSTSSNICYLLGSRKPHSTEISFRDFLGLQTRGVCNTTLVKPWDHSIESCSVTGFGGLVFRCDLSWFHENLTPQKKQPQQNMWWPLSDKDNVWCYICNNPLKGENYETEATLPETNSLLAPENGWLEYFLLSFWGV